MSQAISSRSTPVPGNVTHLSFNFGAVAAAPFARANFDLQQACDAARVAHRAMTLLATSVATLSPEDPRHGAAHAAVDLLRPQWRRHLEAACRLTPSTRGDWIAKSSLLASLVERDETDSVVGGPALQLAASLADDLLCEENAAPP